MRRCWCRTWSAGVQPRWYTTTAPWSRARSRSAGSQVTLAGWRTGRAARGGAGSPERPAMTTWRCASWARRPHGPLDAAVTREVGCRDRGGDPRGWTVWGLLPRCRGAIGMRCRRVVPGPPPRLGSAALHFGMASAGRQGRQRCALRPIMELPVAWLRDRAPDVASPAAAHRTFPRDTAVTRRWRWTTHDRCAALPLLQRHLDAAASRGDAPPAPGQYGASARPMPRYTAVTRLGRLDSRGP
jgi:hypothetical protein